MADEKTRADSMRCFLTGAATHAGTQTDPNLSLGNHQATTEVTALDANRTNPISGITIDFVAGSNGTGTGSLTASAVSGLKWTPPGSSQGVEVTIANGETKIVEGASGGGESKYVRVTRTSAADLTGTETVTLAEKLNNVIGLDDVSSAEQTAGDDEYRCFCIENVSGAQVKDIAVKVGTLGTQRTTDAAQLPASGSGTIQTTGSFADWPSAGFALVKDSGGTLREIVYYESRTDTTLTVPTAGRAQLGTTAAAGTATDTADAIPGIAIGLDAPTSQPTGSFVDNTGSGEGTPPAGITFSTPVTDGDALSIGDLNTTEIYGIWIWRTVPAGATAQAGVLHLIERKFDAA